MEVEMKKTMGRDSGVLSKHLVKNDDNNYMMKTKSSGTGREAKTEGHSKDLFGPDSHPRLHRKKLSPAPRRMIPLFWDTILSATKPTKNAAQHQKPSTTTTTTTTMTTTTTRTRTKTRRTSNKQQTPTYFAKRQKTNPASSLPSLPRTQHFAADSDHMTFCTWQFRCNTTWPWPFHEEIGGNCMKLCHSGSEQFKMFRIWDK